MWRVAPESSLHCPVFVRPLGLTELGFYWTAALRGGCDIYQLLEVGTTDTPLPSDAKFSNTWSSIRRRFPLLAAQVRVVDGNESFVVQENSFANPRPGEVTFVTIPSSGVQTFVLELLDGPRPLSDELLSRLYIIHHSDCTNKLHVLFMTTHFISDFRSTTTIARTFLEVLSSEHDLPYLPLADRLAMVPACEALWPHDGMVAAKRRWRKAIGFALFSVRMAKFKGGNSFPRKGPSDSVRTRMLTTVIPPQISKTILATCRAQGITFGNAFSILTHIAMSRVLHKLYLRGRISEEEWQYRRRQPTYITGPLDLRSSLNPVWYRNGGGGELVLSISFFYFTLCFMPTSPQGILHGTEPPSFSEMLSPERFRLRCKLVQSQARHFHSHPLFLETTTGSHLAHFAHAKSAANSDAQPRSSFDSDSGEEMGSYDSRFSGAVFGYGITNVGVVSFPTPSTAPTHDEHGDATAPRLRVVDCQSYMHCQPGELYISSAVFQEQLVMRVFFDANAYDEEMVQEWLEEVKAACVWYLGRTHLKTVPAGTLQTKL
ncbi:hypothetical protein HYDPIDRAFT_83607 [Hydnomerulius pinastri MD-312]|nr:hypothetical protein HYDPIDRAFT_83607 [Hydnomerulius pinastri MD-312]